MLEAQKYCRLARYIVCHVLYLYLYLTFVSVYVPRQVCSVKAKCKFWCACDAGDAPFDFPLTTFYGSKDRRVTEEMVRGWQTFTTGQFTCTAIDGNHLWPLDKHAKMIWLRHIVDELHANKFIAPAG